MQRGHKCGSIVNLLVALTRVVLGLAGNVCWAWGLGQSNEQRKDV